MEKIKLLQYCCNFLLPALAVLLFVAAARLRRRNKLPFPPGPPPLPVIGNMLIMDQLTHRGLAKLSERYAAGVGLIHLRLGARRVFVVSTPAMARQVLQAQDAVFANRPATIAIAYLSYDRADMAFANYGPFWRQMRKLCVVKLFSKKRAESWTPVREEVAAAVQAVAEKAAAGAAVNIGELSFKLTMRITYRAAFGTQQSSDARHQDEFIAIIAEFSKLFGEFNVADFFPWFSWFDPQGFNKRLKVAREALDKFIDTIIDEHMANPKAPDAADGDMVDEMLVFLDEAAGAGDGNRGAAQKDELMLGNFKLTRAHIKALIMDVMFGGTETVASAIEWAMAELINSPDDMRRLQEELAGVVGLDRPVRESDLEKLPFLKCVTKETLRLHPPIPLLQHQTVADAEVSGYFLSADSRVLVNVWAIGRSEALWKGASEFRPARFAPGGEAAGMDFKGGFFEFLPFGSGRRSCPGMQLGLLGVELAVAQLVHCFDWTLPAGMKPGEIDMGDVFGLTTPKAVKLVASPRLRLTHALIAGDRSSAGRDYL
ncbi:cytochrome P450 84A1-like [Curcuma longa]|uniref:cytochrome P450 84A1-like n=1 Tax=Curcuma longa TaxID=136217 RepID=UPI003D9F0F13